MSTAEEAPGGPTETLRFARLLARLWAQGFTGSFRARAARRPGVTVSKEILFERGRVAWAASDDSEESIRVHLINRGILRPDQWRLAEEKAGPGQARQMLLELGFLTARELQEAERERVTALVLSLFTWREGRYEVSPGAIPHGTPNLKIDPRDLVLEGLMASGDRGRVLDEIGSLDAVLVVRPDDLVRASLSLPVEIVGLMGKADGTRTIADICAFSPLPDFLISAAFAGLKVLGLARSVEGAAAAPPAPLTAPPEKPPTRRRTGWSTDQAAAREKAPLLPLSPPDDFETVPVVATPPGGIRAAARVAVIERAPAHHEDDHSGTRPVGSVAERRLEPEPASLPEESEPIIQVARPPAAAPEAALPPAPPSPDLDGLDNGDGEGGGREPVLELKPGIPVAPFPAPASIRVEHAGAAHLGDEEIEDAIHSLGGSADDDEAPQGIAGDAPFAPMAVPEDEEHEAIELAAAAVEIGSEGAGEPLEDFGEEEAAGLEGAADDEPKEPPPWVYQPSVEPRSTGDVRRWARWGGGAAAVFGLAAALILIAGSGGEDTGDLPRSDGAAAGPVDVVAPAAFTPEPGPVRSGPSVAPASLTESIPAAVTPPSGRSVSSGPLAAASIATAEPREPAPARKPARTLALASAGTGPIFSPGLYQQGRRLIQQGSLQEAASRFRSAIGGRKGLYTVQLALACEPQTVSRSIGSTREPSQIFILPATYRGQSCYRLLWGAYASRDAALKARSGLPSAFLKDPSPPFVAPL